MTEYQVEMKALSDCFYVRQRSSDFSLVIAGCVMLFFFCAFSTHCLAADVMQTPVKKVLVIPSYNINYLGSQWFLQGVFGEFQEHAPFNVTYFHENLQLAAHPGDENYFKIMAESLKIKYLTEKPDLIIVQYKQALQFMNQYGKQIFGDVPVVFAGLEIENYSTINLADNFTGVTAAFNAIKNIDLILHNHPDTHKIYIVAGVSSSERDMVADTLDQAQKYQNRVEFIVLNELPFEKMLEQLRTIQSDGAVLYLSLQIDVTGRVLVPAEVAREIGRVAAVPVYGMLDTYMGSGITGGFLVNHTLLGHRAAEMGISILLGKKPLELAVTNEPLGEYRFDGRELKRWGIDEQRLPVGSKVEYRETSIWEMYRGWIIAGAFLLLFQATLIIILLVSRSIRIKAQAALQYSEACLQKSHQELTTAHEEVNASYEELTATEEELRRLYGEVTAAHSKLAESYQTIQEIFNAASDVIIVHEPETGGILAVNHRATELFGYSEQEFKELGVVAISSPDHLAEALRRIHQTITEGPQLYERETVDRFGSRRILEISSSRALIHGKNCCLTIMRDISERKQMEEKLYFTHLHDSLTGIYNRTYFEQEVQHWQSSGHKNIGLFICDVDGLKLINDTLGHRHGDELLKIVATIMNDVVVSPDFTARIGGDEFAAVLFNSQKKQMEIIEQQYKTAVDTYNQANPNLPLSLSCGWSIDLEGANIDKVFKEADNNMYRQKMHQQQSSRSALVQTMMKALEVRDHITEGHADRLGILMERMAQRLRFPKGVVADLRLLAQFHDIGKVGIPDGILNKTSKLTEDEWTVMRRHCEIGLRIAKASPDLEPIADWILKHQERWDGTGYPLGLSGNDIPLECRIMAIIDAYDAMTNDRPYRRAMNSEAAITEIRQCSGTQFDPKLAEIFIEMIESEGNS